MAQPLAALLDMRQSGAASEGVFPAPTATGHIEKFTRYAFRHTCLTRWAAFIDPYALASLAGHRAGQNRA